MKEMKNKTIVILLSMLVGISVQVVPIYGEGVSGHVHLSLRGKNVPIAGVADSFSRWFAVGGETQFVLQTDETDEIGMRHQTYQQYYKGVKVEANMLIVHSKNGEVSSVNGVVMGTDEYDEACEETKDGSETQGESLRSGNIYEEKIVPYEKNGHTHYSKAYEIEDQERARVIYVDVESGDTVKILQKRHGGISTLGKGKTFYNGERTFTTSYYNNSYHLEDETRKIITYNGNPADTIVGYTNPTTKWGGNYLKSVTIKKSSTWWKTWNDANPDFYIRIFDSKSKLVYVSEVKDDTQAPVAFRLPFHVGIGDGLSIEIYDEDLTTDEYGGTVTLHDKGAGKYTSESDELSVELEVVPLYALDAFWGVQETHDFYKEVFGRNGFDGKNTYTGIFMDPSFEKDDSYAENAMADVNPQGNGGILVGMGVEGSSNPFSQLDVMGHEFTHNVVTTNGHGGLEYLGESGALNESIADIMGINVKNYVLGDELPASSKWLQGEGVFLNYDAIRSFSNPGSPTVPSQQPSYYKGRYWYDTGDVSEENDNGGVHGNSGVGNHWYYLLSEGGRVTAEDGKTYNIQGIGMEKSRQIVYRNLIRYLTPTATYHDAMVGSVTASEDLYGAASDESKAVAKAWCAVGLCLDGYDDGDGDNDNGVDEAESTETSLRIFSKGGKVFVRSESCQWVWLIDVHGRIIEQKEVEEGEWTEFDTNGEKMMVVKTTNENRKVMVDNAD